MKKDIIKIILIQLIFTIFSGYNIFSYGYFIDWDCIANNDIGCVNNGQDNNFFSNNINNKKNNNSNVKDVKDVKKEYIDIITNFNKSYIKKYQDNLKKIEKLKQKIEIENNKNKSEQNKILMKQFKQYIEIEHNINKADYILLIKYDLDNITFVKYKGQTYIFYIYPFIFNNGKNINKEKANKIKLNLKADLQQLLSYNNLIQVKNKINDIKNKYKLSDFYKIYKLSDFYKFNILKLGRITQEKINVNMPNLAIYNTLYYVPKRIEKGIDDKHIYFYIPISKTIAEGLEQSKVIKSDFNKFYCLVYKYNDGFSLLDKTICNFYKRADNNNFIKIDFKNKLNQRVYKVNIKERGKEWLDILIMLSGIILAFIAYAFVLHLRKKKYQYENEQI